MKRYLNRMTAAFAALTLLITFSMPLPVSAAAQFETSKRAACEGLLGTASDSCDDEGKVTGIFTAVLNILALVVGFASIIMIIIGGFKYVTSGGEASSTSSAKNTILYALIGLVIALLARTIIWFVVDRVS